ncbi:MAG: tryptophan-rich sensory protein [Dehalococcoidales bacterium]|nr:tryptophan-rich sensory protein [Dehalococcoidales bacterium]
MDFNSIVKLIVSIVACFAAAVIGSLFTFKAIPGWYAGLKRPHYTPPNWAFGPVWTILYVLMGISVFLIWQDGLAINGASLAFTLFWVQLVFINALWSIIFFGMKSKEGGVVIIIVLWLLILATIITSFRVSGWAGALLIPYIIWVSIASYLNIGIWWLNRQVES